MESFRKCLGFFQEMIGYFICLVFLALFFVMFLRSPGLCAETDKFSSYIETFSQGSIDWDNGMIYGYGKGYIDEYSDKKKALSAARVMASSNIVRLAAGIRLNDVHFMQSLGKNRVSIKLEAFVAYKAENMQLISSGSRPYYEIIRMAPIKGINGLTAQLIDHIKTEPLQWLPPPEKSKDTLLEDDDQPWLVLDARHLSDTAAVKPAVFPKVLTTDGKTIYSPSQVFENALKHRGMAKYVTSQMTHKQLQSSWKNDIHILSELISFLSPDPAFADDSQGKKRARQTFIVKNVNQADGLLNTNLVITAKDAEALKKEDAASKILRNCRVIVVVSSPISGIEGMINQHIVLNVATIPVANETSILR